MKPSVNSKWELWAVATEVIVPRRSWIGALWDRIHGVECRPQLRLVADRLRGRFREEASAHDAADALGLDEYEVREVASGALVTPFETAAKTRRIEAVTA